MTTADAKQLQLVPLPDSYEKQALAIIPVNPPFIEKNEFFKRFELLSIEIQCHALSILIGMKEEASSDQFFEANFVTRESVRKDYSESTLCFEKVHALILTQMSTLNGQYTRHFTIQAVHYCIPKERLQIFLKEFSAQGLFAQWRTYLPQYEQFSKFVTYEAVDLEKHKKNLPKFVRHFNKNPNNQAQYREIALALLEDLKTKAWKYENNIAVIPLESGAPSARQGFIRLYKCDDDQIKETALLYFIELVQRDPLTMKSASDLVKVQLELLKEIAPDKVQNLNRRQKQLLSQAYAANLKCKRHHTELLHLDAVVEQTKQDLWTGSENFKKLNVSEDPEIRFWLKYAIQSAESLRSDKSKLEDVLDRLLGLARVGINLAAIYLDPSAAPQLVDPTFLELAAMFHHIEWKASWYKELSVFEKLCQYSMNNIECFRKVVAIVQSKKNQNYHPDLLYGGIASLEYVISNSINSEIQESGLKLFIQILAMRIPLIGSRVKYAFVQMLHKQGRLGNTVYVILKIMQACRMLEDSTTKALIGDDALNRDTSLKEIQQSLKNLHADKQKEPLYINVIKFFLRWIADVNRATDCGGLSLANLVAAARDNTVVPVIFKCLKELSSDFIGIDVMGRTAYHIAARLGNDTMIRQIHSCLPEVPINLRDYADGKSAVHEASECRSFGTLDALKEIGANLNLQTNDGKTALHWSVEKNELELARKLLDLGADPNISDGVHTPLNIALKQDHPEMARLLISRGAKLAEQIHHCSTNIDACYLVSPIIFAARNQAWKSLRDLIENSKGTFSLLEWMEIMHVRQTHHDVAGKKDLTVLFKSPSFQSALSADFRKNQLIEFAKSPEKLAELKELAQDPFLINMPDSFGLTALHVAVFCGNNDGVDALLAAGANCEAVEMKGFTPLHVAAFIGDEAMVSKLLKKGANANALNIYGDSPLMVYCGNDPERDPESLKKMVGNYKTSPHDNLNIVKGLLEKGNPRQKDRDANTIFHHTCSFGEVNVLKFLLNDYSDIFWQPNSQGLMPVELAIKNKRLVTLKGFLKGLSESELQMHYRNCKNETQNRLCLATILVKMDEPKILEFYISSHREAAYQAEDTQQKYTPLHYAAMTGMTGILDVYLRLGLRLDAKDSFENTAAHLAVLGQHPEFVEKLLAYPEIWNLCNLDKRTPLHLAAAKGSPVVLNLLLSIKQEITKDGNGEYPLHIACRYGRKLIIPQLCCQHKDLEILNDDENTPLHLACIKGDLDIVKVLVEKKANIAAKNIFNETPLHLASQYGHDKIVEFLLSQGADNIATDSQGKTPLHHAVAFRHVKAVTTLLDQEKKFSLPPDVSYVDFPDLNEETSLMELTKKKPSTSEYIEKKSGTILRLLLNHGANIEHRNNNGETFVHLASLNGHAYLLRTLHDLRHSIKYNPFVVDNLKNNALHKACERNEREAAASCIADLKIYVNGLNANELSPLHLCIIKGFYALARDLMYKFHADLTVRTKEKNTLLHLILSKKKLDADLCRLLEEIVLMDPSLIFTFNKEEKTPLHVLAENDHVQAVRILLEYLPGDSDKNKKYVQRKTAAPEFLSALSIAKRDNFEELAKAIRCFPETNYGSKCHQKR